MYRVAIFGSSLGCVATINFPLTTSITLNCYGDVSHVNWWICETKESDKKKTQLGWNRLGSIDSTVGKYFELDKIISICNLNLINGFFRSDTYVSPVEVCFLQIFIPL